MTLGWVGGYIWICMDKGAGEWAGKEGFVDEYINECYTAIRTSSILIDEGRDQTMMTEN